MAKSPKAADTPIDAPIDALLNAEPGSDNTSEARARFAKALDEARAGAEALGKEARQRGEAASEKLTEVVAAKRLDLIEEPHVGRLITKMAGPLRPPAERLRFETYAGGHMFYIRAEARKAFRADGERLIGRR